MLQGVLVYTIDRFGRDLTQTLLNEKRLNDNGVILLSVTENFTDDASGRFFRNLMMAYAQYYSDELSAKIRRGMDYNVERYWHLILTLVYIYVLIVIGKTR